MTDEDYPRLTRFMESLGFEEGENPLFYPIGKRQTRLVRQSGKK